ncbi:MAG: RNA-binding protein [Sedimenticola sp.]|uniref:RRM domain-containing protein n=1 Tax=Sedimenticola thiotaurini TaxID=1543721 RepID=A0A558CW94_9GAMM|nr:RNA-binding protein [Sedimenticola sp.]MCW8950194.1 RNA-binding protein [Sedimenticola sp.]TVT53015.1 MAG: hypothetical protein FHK82_12515 [Sedimenticola thiotaurini]
MWIIIQGIPLTTTQRELNQFLNNQLNGRSWLGFNRNPAIRLKSFSILKMTDRSSGTMECHGLAELETKKPDEETLQALNGHQLQGRTIAVRKYYHRSSRRIAKRDANQGLCSPVQQERRRPYLHIEMLKSTTDRLTAGLL